MKSEKFLYSIIHNPILYILSKKVCNLFTPEQLKILNYVRLEKKYPFWKQLFKECKKNRFLIMEYIPKIKKWAEKAIKKYEFLFNIGLEDKDIRKIFLRELSKVITASGQSYRLYIQANKRRVIKQAKENLQLQRIKKILKVIDDHIENKFPEVFKKKFYGKEMSFSEQIFIRFQNYFLNQIENETDYEKLIDKMFYKHQIDFEMAMKEEDPWREEYKSRILKTMESWWNLKELEKSIMHNSSYKLGVWRVNPDFFF